MKRTTRVIRIAYLLAIVIMALSIGACRDQSLRSSQEGKMSSRVMFVNPSPRCSAIPLSGVLRDPDATEDPFIEIRGQVVSSLNCEPSTNHTLVDVGLTMKAEIKPLLTDSVKWRLSGKSVDRINVCDVSEEGTAVLDKSYPVEGRGDGLQLHLKFQITPSRIELAAVWFDHCTTAQRSNQTNDSN